MTKEMTFNGVNDVEMMEKQTKEESIMNDIKNVLHPIQTIADVVDLIADFPGIHKETKNFAKIVDAVVAGHSVLAVLENPVELAGIAPQQKHYFDKFLSTYSIPKRLKRAKNIRVLVAQADLETIDDNMMSQRKYNEFFVGDDKVSGYKEISGSYAAELLSQFYTGAPESVKVFKKVNGQLIEKNFYGYILKDFFIVDANDNERDPDIKALLLEKKRQMVKEGFFYKDSEGITRRVRFVMQSPSQERQVLYFGVGDHVAHPVDVLEKLGHFALAYAKVVGQQEDGTPIYEVDYVKAMKRFGLTLSNSIKSNFIQIGSEVTKDEVTGDVIITGGNVVVRIVEDVYSEVTQGKFKAFRKEKAFDKNGNLLPRGQVFDAADHPVEIVAGDGQFYFNDRVKVILEREFGRDFQNGISRIFNGYSKGNGVYIPNLNKYFKEDIVIPKSAFKGSLDTLSEVLPMMNIQFRVALFGTPLRFKKQYVKLPYQFAHGMNLSAESMLKLIQPHLDRVKDMLTNAEELRKYVGIEKVEKLLTYSDLSQEEKEEALDNTLVSVLTTFLYYVPESYVDVYLKEKALDLLKDLIKEWKGGLIPVEANYRFLVQDPYALLETYRRRGTNKEIRKNGKLFVDPKLGLKANTAFILERDGRIMGGDVAIARNPQMTKGQSRIVKCVADQRYTAASGKGAFEGMIVLSAHDFNAQAMGGADFDGDTALVLTDPILVDAVKRATASHAAFLDIHFFLDKEGNINFDDGCPYQEDKAKMAKFKYRFTLEEYNRELVIKMYEDSLDYVADKLMPNRIGELTNYATKLADAIRTLGYKMMQAQTQEEYNYLKERIAFLEEKIDLLAWVQSWEIDRAKHGGAYEEALAEELDFIKNPPAEVRYLDKNDAPKWITPDWMGYLKGKEVDGVKVVHTNSVLSKVHQYIMYWEETELDRVVAEMRKDYKDNNLLGILTANIAMPTDPVIKHGLIKAVTAVKNQYNNDLRNAYQYEENEKAKVEMAYFPNPYAKVEELERIEKERKDLIALATERATFALHELEANYLPEHIGVAAYQLVYSQTAGARGANEENPAKGLSFPWRAATRQLLIALRKALQAEDKPMIEKQVRTFKPEEIAINKVRIGNFAPSVRPQDIVNKMATWNNQLAIKVEQVGSGIIFNVYIKQEKVGSVFPDYIHRFAGGKAFVVKAVNIETRNKSLQFHIEAIQQFA